MEYAIIILLILVLVVVLIRTRNPRTRISDNDVIDNFRSSGNDATADSYKQFIERRN